MNTEEQEKAWLLRRGKRLTQLTLQMNDAIENEDTDEISRLINEISDALPEIDRIAYGFYNWRKV